MRHNLLETIIGAFVILVAILFTQQTYKSTSTAPKADGYEISARFEEIGDVTTGTDVRIAGIKVGTVVSEELDTNSYQAILSFNINNSVSIPTDSIASIVSSGLLGRKYVAINPGAEIETLRAGDEIIHTQSAINIETLIGKFIFNNNSGSL